MTADPGLPRASTAVIGRGYGRSIACRARGIAIIPTMQPMRRNPEVVENNKQPVLDRRSPGPFLRMTPRRRRNWRIEHRDFPGCAQSPRKFHVFHERNFGKAAQFLENFAPDKNRLVAVERASMSRQETRHGLQPHQARMPSVEFSEESPADHVRIHQGIFDGSEMTVIET